MIGGPATGRRLDPDPELVLGRTAEGDGRLDHDHETSRRHARVWRVADGTLQIEDLGSANGTWVNGERIGGVRALVPGDTVQVGQTQIRVTDPLGEVPSETQASADLPDWLAPAGKQQLELVSGPDAGRRIEFDDELVIGRAVAGDGRLADDPEVSRRHARVRRDDAGGLRIEDLNSGNGTWLNGGRVEEEQELAPGDRIKIGQTVYAVTDPAGAVPAQDAQRSRVRERPGLGVLGTLAGVLASARWAVVLLVLVFVVVAGVFGLRVATLLSKGDDFNDPAASSILAGDRLADAAGAEPGPGVFALVESEDQISDPNLDRAARRSGRRARRLQREAEQAQSNIQTPEDQLAAQEAANEAQAAADEADADQQAAEDARSQNARDKLDKVDAALEDDPAVDESLTYFETGAEEAISEDRRQSFVAAFLKPDIDTEALADRLEESLGAEPQVSLGGSALAGSATSAQAEEDLRAAEMIALPLLFICSLFVFRGVVAALLPLVVGIVTVLGTFLGLRLLNEVWLQSIFALNMVVGLGLGLSIDYSLFILSRYREELARSGPGLLPLQRTLQTAGRTVLFSAMTVCVALASLLVFPQRFLYSMGAGGLICTVIGAGTALIVLPALLAILGPRVNSLAPKFMQQASERAARGDQAGFWYRLSQAVMRRPLPIALVSGGLLIAAGIPFANVQFTGIDARVLPATSELRQVDTALKEDFADNPAAPISLAIDAPEDAQERLDDYVADLEDLPDVASVSAPDRLEGDVWQIDVTPDQDTFEPRTLDLVERIRDGPAPFPTVPAGVSAAFVDQQSSLAENLPTAVAILVAATLVILFLLTGSVVLPIKSVLMNALGLSATFGLLVLIFQDGNFEGLLGFDSLGALNATQPILVLIVAFGLSTDYGVFLLTRIKEFHDAGMPNAEAVARGLERTGRIVTAAALLFSVALGAFATSEIILVKIIGVGAVLAVIIDSTIIRALLVPSLMAMLGTRNWWAPKPLRKLHERVGLSEG